MRCASVKDDGQADIGNHDLSDVQNFRHSAADFVTGV